MDFFRLFGNCAHGCYALFVGRRKDNVAHCAGILSFIVLFEFLDNECYFQIFAQ